MDLKQAHEMFSYLWRYYKQFFDVLNCDEYWDDVVSTATEIHKKYPYELCKRILMDIMSEFEKKVKTSAKYKK